MKTINSKQTLSITDRLRGQWLIISGTLMVLTWNAPAQGPEVTNTIPSANAEAAGVGTLAAADFDSAINSNTLDENSFFLTSPWHGRVTGDPEWHASSLEAVLTPSGLFFAGELLRANLTRQICGTNGNSILPHQWQFRICSGGGSPYLSTNGQCICTGECYCIALSDFNKDSSLDVYLGLSDQPDLVITNDGSGIFHVSQTTESNDTRGVLSADVNGDSWPDVVFWSTVTIYVRTNDRSGHVTLSPWNFSSSWICDVAAGDLDGDGDVDLYVSRGGGKQNLVLTNDGSGAFYDSGQALGVSDARGVALGDLDGDGDLDIFITCKNNGYPANRPNRVQVNDGHGHFSDTGQSLGTNNSYAVALGDVNGDGFLDAVVANGYGAGNRVYTNDGTASFWDTGQDLGTGTTYAVCLGDLNGDGSLDLFAANYGQSDVVYTNDGSGFFHAAWLSATGNSEWVELGDLDGDGTLDAAVAASLGQASRVLMNPGQISAPAICNAENIHHDSFVARWNQRSCFTNYFLDVSSSPAFENDAYLAGYSNRSVGNSASCVVTGLDSQVEIYYYRVRGRSPWGTSTNSGIMEVFITSRPKIYLDQPTSAVFFAEETTRVAGSNNAYIVGQMWWTNYESEIGGSFNASPQWEISDVLLAIGTNHVEVWGTNSEGMVTSAVAVVERGGYGPPEVWADCPAATATYYAEYITLSGSNNIHVAGTMTWSNILNGSNGTIQAGSAWEASGIYLSVGTNDIIIVATNCLGEEADTTVVRVRLPYGEGTPVVAITSTPTNVPWSEFETSLSGTNNGAVCGIMWWTNSAAGEGGTLPASRTWTISGVSLVIGPNHIEVFGTNAAGDVANDSIDVIRSDTAENLRLYVATNGANIFPYTNWNMAATDIQTAIDAAPYLSEVIVGPGTYLVSTTIVVKQRVRLKGAGADFTRLLATGALTNFASSNDVVRLQSDSSICGFYIRGPGTVAGLGQAGIEARYWGQKELDVIRIFRNVVENCPIGISLNNLSAHGKAWVYNNTVLDCWVGIAENDWGTIHCYNNIVTGCDEGILRYNCPQWHREYNDVWGNGTNWVKRIGDTPYPEATPTNNLCADPRFIDPTQTNCHLCSDSPCIDAGIVLRTMDPDTDLEGNPRPIYGQIDIGAFESPARVDVRLFLQGPFIVSNAAMRTDLASKGWLPTTSPYYGDIYSATNIPSNVVDWTLVEFLTSTSSAPILSRPALLGSDGYVMSENGCTGILLALPATSYYVRVKHRNHLAVMTAEKIMLTGQATMVDFASDPAFILGGTNGVVQVGSNIWALRAGDVDGDGEITVADSDIGVIQLGMEGYWRADIDLDGGVSVSDLTFVSNHYGETSAAIAPETLLIRSLTATPAQCTVTSGEECAFTIAGAEGGLHWTFPHNRSGAVIAEETITSAVYTAGSTGNCVDVVEAFDDSNQLVRIYVNVVSNLLSSAAEKAVILAGWKGHNDPLWPATQFLADKAYNTFLYRGYPKEAVRYLSPDEEHDADGNGLADDIDAEATYSNVEYTFTNWVLGCSNLFVYLVDHGESGTDGTCFRLGPSEVLYATNLDAWLDDLQNTYSTRVTLVVDCCYAGNFVGLLSYTGAPARVNIASCSSNEASFFVAGGLISFSDAFINGIMMGKSIMESYSFARDTIAHYQTALYQDNGGGSVASNQFVGFTFLAARNIPTIGRVAERQILYVDTEAVLWASDITSRRPLKRVWCIVVEPSYSSDPDSPVNRMPELALAYNKEKNRYQQTYGGFAAQGVYKTVYYASDDAGAISFPRISCVVQNGYQDRAIIVMGGPTNWTDFDSVTNIATRVFSTLQRRFFDKDHIECFAPALDYDLDGDGYSDIDELLTEETLGECITNRMATNGTSRLTLYVIAHCSNSAIRLNNTEWLEAGTLDDWLDQFQSSNRSVYAIFEVDRGGDWLSKLMPPQNRHRITIACTQKDRPSMWEQNGCLSFSSFFLDYIAEGYSIGEAFNWARRYIRRASHGLRQRACMDDNGDGLFSPKTEGSNALTRFIGPAFVTGDDTPVLGECMPDTILLNTNALLLWCKHVTSLSGITSVTCRITPPDYEDSHELDLVYLAWNSLTERYEYLYTNFSKCGTYSCIFCAELSNGLHSLPTEIAVVRPDEYEVDDTKDSASCRAVGMFQLHNIHSSNDVDWVRFYAVSNYSYEISAVQLGSNCDLVLDLYYELPNGSLSNVDHIDDFGPGYLEEEYTGLDFPTEGWYFVRVSATNFAPGDTSYELLIWVPIGGWALHVVVADALHPAFSPPGTVAIVDNVLTQAFTSGNVVAFDNLAPGIHTVRVETAPGYFLREHPSLPGQATNLDCYGYANPQRAPVSDENLTFATFCFVPRARVDGILRDKLTGEWISDAHLEWVARDGVIAGVVYSSFPPYTAYASNWLTLPNGAFPSNVWLPTVSWDLTVHHDGYSNYVQTNIVFSLAPGGETNLGSLLLCPIDTDGDGMADEWESAHFGSISADPAQDADADSYDNQTEYQVGTDPLNAASHPQLFSPTPLTSGIEISWPVFAGRRYSVEAADTLASGTWNVVYGPTDAPAETATMTWTDNPPVDLQRRYYRVKISLP